MASGADEIAEVLLVEPNPGDTRLFTENLKDAKFTNNVYTVTNGDSALDFLYQRGEYSEVPRPDLMLLDPRCPGRSGSEIITELQNDPALRDIAVVVMTSSQSEEEILKSMEFEAATYVEKPVGQDDFITFAESIEEFWLALIQKTPED